jgi:hypothetical protein
MIIAAIVFGNTFISQFLHPASDLYIAERVDMSQRAAAFSWIRVSINAGWALGLRGLPTVFPYVVLVAALLVTTIFMVAPQVLRRLVSLAGALLVAVLILGAYRFQLSYRPRPVPYAFLPWMHKIWEPRHPGLNLRKLLAPVERRSIDRQR